ncbi:MAG: SPOR domain-containing protein, partial [Rikenellaceae bacterium]
MKLRKYISTAIVLTAMSLIAFSSPLTSVTARVSGLETDSVYMALLEQEQVLKTQEDSIQSLISNIRANFANTSEEQRQTLSREILESENALFEVRNQTGIVSSKINDIEQTYIINNLNKSNGSSQTSVSTSNSQVYASSNSDLYANQFFKDNLSGDDLATLLSTREYESQVAKLEANYLDNYKTLSLLKSNYAACDNQYTADTIMQMFATVENLNLVIEDSLNTAMGYVFDNKLYALTYLYDKTNNEAMFNSLQSELEQMHIDMDARPSGSVSEVIYNLPVQRRFLCDQEIALANKLKASNAADSLKLLKAKLLTQNYDMPDVAIEDRIFIKYDSIVVVKTQIYNASNPIPTMEHYRRGTVYRISVGGFTKAQPASVFRYTAPVYCDVADSKYNYYIGGFATLEEAEAAQAQLKQIGFRRPEVVVWVDDVFENLADGASSTSVSTSAATSSAKVSTSSTSKIGEP